MRKVFLHGRLGEKFGQEWDLEVESAAEAIRALQTNIPEFRNYLINKHLEGICYTTKVGDEFINEKEYDVVTNNKPITIAPVPSGDFDPATWAAIGTWLTAGGVGSMIAVSLVMAGLSYLLFSQSKPPRPDDPVQKSSFLFQGASNVTAQGNFVPIGYGRLRTGSQVISSSLEASPMKTITTASKIEVNIIEPTIE